MIGFLRAILDALGKLLAGQKAASDQVATLESSMDTQFAAQVAAIEYLRELIEGDELPAAVGTPTFTITSIPTGNTVTTGRFANTGTNAITSIPTGGN